MVILRIVFTYIGIFLAIGIGLLLALALTGRVTRAYTVLPPESSVVVADQSISIQNLAEKYQPQMYIGENNPTPPLLWTFYEVVNAGKTIDLTYYNVWENEINPNPTLDRAYWLFRAAYYGYPVRDIEFIEVRIDQASGKISELLFETSPADNYFVTISEHIRARYLLQPDGSFTEIRAARNNKELSRQDGITPMFIGTHIQALAQTWNHLTRLMSPSDQSTLQLSSTLKPLSHQEYRAYKFTRKSQGDHQTIENKLTLLMTSVATAVLIYVPAGVYLLFRRIRKSQTRV